MADALDAIANGRADHSRDLLRTIMAIDPAFKKAEGHEEELLRRYERPFRETCPTNRASGPSTR
jgi:hypothetical protein